MIYILVIHSLETTGFISTKPLYLNITLPSEDPAIP